ncbi:MAG TPA: methyltransferase domain-containing protein [Ktedonobacteraceae bacterium]|nr:methyltransferase domain-containing protein [Ktedonobacteraceae bacterium]
MGGQTIEQSSYDEIADWYNESMQDGSLLAYLELFLPHLFALMGDVPGLRICDLACGQGYLSRKLAERGAQVVGIDLSANMLAYARVAEEYEPSGIIYIQDDARTLDTQVDASFDGVLCNLALMDIPDLYATFQSIYRILRHQGWFVFSILHPCYLTSYTGWIGETDGRLSRKVRGYFEEGFRLPDNPSKVRSKVGAYYRTLSTYLNTLLDTGFTLERLIEPQAPPDVDPRFRGYREIPSALMVRGRKMASYRCTS